MSDFSEVKSTRSKILRYLLINRSEIGEGATVGTIASALGVTPNAIRQELKFLVNEELIIKSEKKRRTGRPANIYSIHENALELFPKDYTDFSVRIINIMKTRYGNKETQNLLDEVWDSVISEMMEDTGGELKTDQTDLRARLEKITSLFRIYGKYPELIEEENSFALKNYNCLLFNIAKADPLICQVDKSLLERMAGLEATKERCIRDGDPYCLYRFQKLSQKTKSLKKND